LAKIWVYSTAAIIQSAILVAIVVYGKGGPTQGHVVVGNATVGLFLNVAGTSVAGAILGLALSALARSNEQIMPMLVVLVISQLVFCGGMIPVAHRLLVDQLSWFTPARWGFAASASTVDLIKLVPTPSAPRDSFWKHTPKRWIFDMAMLGVLCTGYATFVRWKIRLKGE
jgi:ABC-type transport system involved in multi-copper enzyme maturation permease subunit